MIPITENRQPTGPSSSQPGHPKYHLAPGQLTWPASASKYRHWQMSLDRFRRPTSESQGRLYADYLDHCGLRRLRKEARAWRFDLEDAQQMRRGALGPAWRWQLVKVALATGEAPEPCLDSVGRDALQYLRLDPAQRRISAGSRHQNLAAAIEFWQGSQLREQLQLLVIGGFSPEEIAERFVVRPEVVEIVESLNFDVRPLLSATSWVNLHVIQRAVEREEFDFAARLRIAFFGGPVVAKLLIESGDKLPAAEAERLLHRELFLHAKLQACIEAPLSMPKERSQFVQICLDHVHRTNELELERAKFREACEEHRRAHELALLQAGATIKVAPGDGAETDTAGTPPVGVPAMGAARVA